MVLQYFVFPFPGAIRQKICFFMFVGTVTYFLITNNDTIGMRKYFEYKSMKKTGDKRNSLFASGHIRNIGTYMKKNEIRHIAFLKVHRTGSGTLKQIFLKFGHERNLTFVLPNLRETRTRGVISEVHTLTNKNILPPPNFHSYDILCCHVIYQADAFKAILPSDAVYIGVVREPLLRFQSAIHFYEPPYILELQGPTPLSTYSENPLKYEPNDPRLSMTNNRMAVDFGFPMRLFPGYLKNESKNEIYKYIQQLDNDFKVIIINEQFEESLVLIKRLLNWSIRDILFIRKHVTKSFSKRNTLTEADKMNIKDFLYLDNALYEFAVKRLNRQIHKEGDSFQTEVNCFRHVTNVLKEYCENKSTQDSSRIFQCVQLNNRFKISRTDCTLLQMKNLNDVERIRMYGSLNQ